MLLVCLDRSVFKLIRKKIFIKRITLMSYISKRFTTKKKTYFTLPYFVRPNDNYLPSNSDRKLDKQRQ